MPSAIEDAPARPALWAIANFALAVIVAAASLGGILLPTTYAREVASWAAQGLGQDWFDLVVLAPLLVVAGALSLRGSRRARLILGGALVYTVYTFVIYAMCVHFNSLFLLYCAGLGLSVFSLASLAGGLAADGANGWYDGRVGVKLAAGVLIGSAVAFAGLWLSDIIPALVKGVPPASLAEGGFFTNPVHVLDLSLVLPALALGGASLLRRRPLGFWLAPILLTFSALMAVTLAVLVLVMRARGISADLAVPATFAGVAAVDALVLVRLMRHVRDRA